ncbi:MAG: YsnF/AvaK domain-containing protein [Bacteroidota bacterium]
MAQTVIGIFNSASEAQNAKQQLISNGFTDMNVDIASGDTIDYTNRSDNDREHESGIARFFRNLFGGDDNESERYTRVAEHGCVVTVHAMDEEEAERAADLLDDYGAVDVDENYRKYTSNDSSSSWGTNPGTGNRSEPVVAGTPMGDTYVDTDQTTSGMVNDRTLDRDTNRSGGIFDDGSTTRTDSDRDRDGRLFNRDSDRNREYSDDESRKIPIIEETLNVGKREIETGGVRLRSRIVEKPVEEHLRLREEHVRVERNSVDRNATASDIDSFNEETVEMRERAEVPVVSKEAHIVEEVSLDKQVDHRDETINETVRSTEVDIEELEGERRKRDLDA